MKKVITFLLAAAVGLSSVAYAQDQDETTGHKIKKGAKKTGKAIGKGAKKAANKTAEYTVKGASKIADKKYEGKVAANGEKVYITGDNRYYWVDKKGGRHFVTEAELKSE